MSDLHKNYQAYQELQAQIKALQEKATLLMMEGRATAITDIRALIAAYDLKPEELGYPAAPSLPKRDRKPEKKRDRTVKGAPKYRDPETGVTWPGTGRAPNWIIGKNYDDFLIEKAPTGEQGPPPPAQEFSPPVPAPAPFPAAGSSPQTAWAATGAPHFGQPR